MERDAAADGRTPEQPTAAGGKHRRDDDTPRLACDRPNAAIGVEHTRSAVENSVAEMGIVEGRKDDAGRTADSVDAR